MIRAVVFMNLLAVALPLRVLMHQLPTPENPTATGDLAVAFSAEIAQVVRCLDGILMLVRKVLKRLGCRFSICR